MAGGTESAGRTGNQSKQEIEQAGRRQCDAEGPRKDGAEGGPKVHQAPHHQEPHGAQQRAGGEVNGQSSGLPAGW